MADDYDRLFLAAQILHPAEKIDGPSALATFLGLESPQMTTNWKRRGVPRGRIVALSRRIGCRPEWLASGDGPMTSGDVESPASEEKPASPYGEPVTDKEVELLRDLRELLADRWDHYANAIRAEANVARAYKSMGLANPSPVPDEQVAEHLPPAPAVPPVERRHGEDRRALFPGERRHSFGPNGFTPQKRSRRAEK